MYERDQNEANPDNLKAEYYNDINQEFGNADVSGKFKLDHIQIIILTNLFFNSL